MWGAQEGLSDYMLMMWTQTRQGPLCLRPTDVAEPSPGEAHDGKAFLHTRVHMLTVCAGNVYLSFLPCLQPEGCSVYREVPLLRLTKPASLLTVPNNPVSFLSYLQ